MGAIIEDVLLQLEGKERILADSVAILLFIIFLFIAFRGYKLFKFVAGFEVAALVFVRRAFCRVGKYYNQSRQRTAECTQTGKSCGIYQGGMRIG